LHCKVREKQEEMAKYVHELYTKLPSLFSLSNTKAAALFEEKRRQEQERPRRSAMCDRKSLR